MDIVCEDGGGERMSERGAGALFIAHVNAKEGN